MKWSTVWGSWGWKGQDKWIRFNRSPLGKWSQKKSTVNFKNPRAVCERKGLYVTERNSSGTGGKSPDQCVCDFPTWMNRTRNITGYDNVNRSDSVGRRWLH